MAILKNSYRWVSLIIFYLCINKKFFSKLRSIWMMPLCIHSSSTSILISTIPGNDELVVLKNSYWWFSLFWSIIWIHSKFILDCFSISPVNFSVHIILVISNYNESVIWEHSYNWKTLIIRALALIITVNFKFNSFSLSIGLEPLSRDIFFVVLLVTDSNYDVSSIQEDSNLW